MKKISWFLLATVMAFSCHDIVDDELLQEEQTKAATQIQRSQNAAKAKPIIKNAPARTYTENGINCEESEAFPVMINSTTAGSGSLSVTETDLLLDLDVSINQWFLSRVRVFAGLCNAIPSPENFPYDESFTLDDEVRTYSLAIPLEDLPECGCVSVVIELARFNPTTSVVEKVTTSKNVDYCKCGEEPPPPPDDKNLRTQTQGGWGAVPRGNNPGVYLHANFDDAFPDGLMVGCNYWLTLTSAQAVTDFLPQGGKPAALTQDYVDPTIQINVLVGQVVALKLSVMFDLWDEDFGESATHLVDAIVTSGMFEGWTVGQVLAEAEKVLGGCESVYTPSQMNDILSAINSSFVDGNTDSDLLENAGSK